MKCDICGFFVEEPLTICPMCGGAVNQPEGEVQPETQEQSSANSNVQEPRTQAFDNQSVRTFVAAQESAGAPRSASIDSLSWDTKDFPAPRKVEDIQFVWPESATKDYPTIFTEEPSEPAPAEKYESAESLAAKYESAESLAAKYESAENASDASAIEAISGQAAPAAEESDEDDSDVLTIEKILAGVTLQEDDSKEDNEEAAENTEHSEVLKAEDLIPESKETERPMFYTFQTKTDEFQKLLDKEYERIHSIYGEDFDPMKGATIPPFAPEERVRAKDLSDFERMLEDVPSRTEPTAAQRFFTQDPSSSNSDSQSFDLGIDEFEDSLRDTTRMSLEQIEDTIRALEEEEIIAAAHSAERKRRLAEMAAARETYFRDLDNLDRKGRPVRKQEPSYEETQAAAKSAVEDFFGTAENATPADPMPVQVAEPEAVSQSAADESKPAVDLKAALAAAAWLGMDTEKVVASYANAPEKPVENEEAQTADTKEEIPAADSVEDVAPAADVAAEVEASEPEEKPATSLEEALAGLRAVSERTRPYVGRISDEAEDLAARYENGWSDSIIKEEPEEAAPAEEPAPEAAAEEAAPEAVGEEPAPEADAAEEPAPKLSYKEEIANKLADLEALYGNDVEVPDAEVPHTAAISFYFDKDKEEPLEIAEEALAEPAEQEAAPEEPVDTAEEPAADTLAEETPVGIFTEEPEAVPEEPADIAEEPVAEPIAEEAPADIFTEAAAETAEETPAEIPAEENSADETPQYEAITDVRDIIEERPLRKDPLEITNETSSLAFLYDDLPAEEVAGIARESGEGQEVDIIPDAAWNDLWAKPVSTEDKPEEDVIDVSSLIIDEPEVQEPEEPAAEEQITAEPPEVPTAEVQPAEEAEEPAQKDISEESAADAAEDSDDIRIFKKNRREAAAAEDTAEAEDEEPEDYPEEQDEEKESSAPSHIVLKIIAVLLVLCAIFEGAVLLLAKFAPDAGITQSLVGVEESIVSSIGGFFSSIFGGGK